jgi:hypothetical protein
MVSESGPVTSLAAIDDAVATGVLGVVEPLVGAARA